MKKKNKEKIFCRFWALLDKIVQLDIPASISNNVNNAASLDLSSEEYSTMNLRFCGFLNGSN
jgi:hypothetical protein